MLRDWEKQHPGRIESMFSALQNVVPSHLMDGKRYDFRNLQATGEASEDGDVAFDPPSFGPPAIHTASFDVAAGAQADAAAPARRIRIENAGFEPVYLGK
jgi:hypothetical protein